MRILCIALVLVGFGFNAASAKVPVSDIRAVTVLADHRLAIPLSRLASLFTTRGMISISVIYGDSAAHTQSIIEGETADMLITASAEQLEQLRNMGLVDVYSIGELVRLGDAHFHAAVVASENMPAAREFLDFLRSKEARSVFMDAPALPIAKPETPTPSTNASPDIPANPITPHAMIP